MPLQTLKSEIGGLSGTTLLRLVGVIALLAIMALSAPIVWAILSAGAGLLALAALAAGGLLLFQLLPLGFQKMENELLRQRKEEARRNPIEQLQNEMLRRAGKLRAFHAALVTVGGQIASIETMLEDRKHKDPSHVLHRQQRALVRLQQFHAVNLRRLGEAQNALDEFGFTIERKESEWRIALAIHEASDMLDPNASDNLMQELLTDSALRSVQDRFNQVFAELDVQMTSMDGPTRDMLDSNALERLGTLDLARVEHGRGRK